MRPRSTLPLLLLAGALAFPGCVASTAYPPRPGQEYSAGNVSHPAIEEICIEALRWTLKRYPVPEPLATPTEDGGVYAINCPQNMNPRVYARIVEACGPAARPLTPETEHLPTYHVGRIVVRADKAEIDIYRPVMNLGETVEILHQPITLFIEGGLKPWRVQRSRPWAIGAFPLPPANYYQSWEDQRRARRAGATAEPAPELEPETMEADESPAPETAAPETPDNE